MLATLLGLTLFTYNAAACEPAVPLLMIYGGNWFYAFVGLPIIIAIKCIAFGRLERSLTPFEATGLMAAANVYSTFFGLLAALVLAIPYTALISPLLVFAASLAPAGRILRHVNWAKEHLRAPRWVISLGFALAFVASVFLFILADAQLGRYRYGAYWVFKFGYATVGLVVSIILTACWEEQIISRLAARRHPESSYFVPVIRANYVAFMIVLLIGALYMLPTRLRSEGFLFTP